MIDVKKIFALILILVFTSPLKAHVQHYDNLKKIEFDIYRNNTHIGQHIFSFEKSGSKLLVKSKINFKIRKFGIDLYKYSAEGTEVFVDGVLSEFSSKTKQNKKQKYVNMKLENDKYVIEGSSYKGDAPKDYVLGTWWNHSIIKASSQISAVSGRIIEQNVEFLGKEKISINEKEYNTLHFNFTSADKKLAKDKKLNTHVWYDEDTLNWVKASFNKKGKWEYRLVLVE